jgi:hypothetical protein
MKGTAPTIRNRYLFLADLLAILASVFISFALRLDVGDLFVSYLPLAIWLAVQAVVIKPIVFWTMGLYRRYWAYASVQELMLIFSAVGLSSLILGAWVFVNIILRWNLVPRSIVHRRAGDALPCGRHPPLGARDLGTASCAAHPARGPWRASHSHRRRR